MADIKQIKLPSGNTYDLKDATARTAISSLDTAVASHSADILSLQQQIAGGVSFNIVWTQTDFESSTAPTNTKLATIPQGVTVYYNNGLNSSTGTLVASSNEAGKFYLIYSLTQVGTDGSNGQKDIYDEYVAVSTSGTTYSWEKIGDTQVQLGNLVTEVALNKSTDTVIGSDATFTVTQPTVTLNSYDQEPGAGTIPYIGDVSSSKTYLSASATGGGATWNSKDSKTVLTGVKANTTRVKATATTDVPSWGSTDTKTVLTGVKTNNTNVKATASGGGAAWNSKDLKTVVTSVEASTKNLATTTISTLSATNTTASKATASTNQTTLKSTFASSSTNTDWLKGATVSNECLTLGAATHDTQTTTQFTFSDVTVPVRNSSDVTVATGQVTTGTGGASVATDVNIGSSVSVIGSNATFTNTQPTIALASGATAGTGVIALAYGAAANGTAAVLGTSAAINPITVSVSLSSGASSDDVTSVALAYEAVSNGTATVIGSSATLSNTQPTVSLSSGSTSGTGKVQVVYEVSATDSYLDAVASGANVAWNEKDQVTVLTSATSLSVTKATP